jgi:RHS repeat-associated protein
MTDASGTTTYTYDSMDRLSSKATPEGTLNYAYDAAGNLASMQSADGAVNVSYAWNSLNLLEQVADSRLGTTSYQYDTANNLSTMTYPNQVQSTFTYDKLNRVTGMASGSSAYAYGRGPTGNLTSAVESNNRSLTWSFDGIYRLTGETISGDPSNNNGSISYSLDPVGNRLSDTSSLPDIASGSWSYNADDEVSSESDDSNGNVTATGGKSFTYDSENHLVSMTATGKSVGMVYDGDGNRVAKTVNGVTTLYLVDDLNPTGYPQVVEELNGARAVERTYTYGLQRISEYQVVNGAWAPSFYGYDGGGNVRNLTNAAGAVTDSYEYDAFGNSFTVSGTTPNNYLYRGEQFDPDLGLYYLRARYYNPITGRFMSRDPENGRRWIPATLHKYLYAQADPVNRRDPSGREALEEYRVTFICGGTLYCGPTVTWTGIKIAAAWALIASELGEALDFATNPEAPPPPVHNPDEPEPGDPNPPVIGSPVGGPPPPPPPEPPY